MDEVPLDRPVPGQIKRPEKAVLVELMDLHLFQHLGETVHFRGVCLEEYHPGLLLVLTGRDPGVVMFAAQPLDTGLAGLQTGRGGLLLVGENFIRVGADQTAIDPAPGRRVGYGTHLTRFPPFFRSVLPST